MTVPSTNIADWDICTVATAIKSRSISCLDVVEACLKRIEELNGTLHAFIEVDSDSALSRARALDASLSSNSEPGVLHGVPLAHKDLFYRKGRITACGSRVLMTFRPTLTATVIQNLASAGAVDLGRLNMSEFALGVTGHNETFGDCRNPWNTDFVAGGSSSGSASAVAARMVFGALGSDTGGSIRHPSSFCGVVGIKPTQGLVPNRGVFPLSPSLEQAGPIARTVRGVARLLSVIVSTGQEDSCTFDYEAGLCDSVQGLRIGVPTKCEVSEEVGRSFEASIDTLESLGFSVKSIELPDLKLHQQIANLIQSVEAASYHRHWLAHEYDRYSEQVRSRIVPGLFIPAVDYYDALRIRTVLSRQFASEVFNTVDVLHIPTTPFTAPSLCKSNLKANPGFRRLLADCTKYTRPFNLLGFPALSLPSGVDTHGLPIGVQFVGPAYSERTILAIGHQYQTANPVCLSGPPSS